MIKKFMVQIILKPLLFCNKILHYIIDIVCVLNLNWKIQNYNFSDLSDWFNID